MTDERIERALRSGPPDEPALRSVDLPDTWPVRSIVVAGSRSRDRRFGVADGFRRLGTVLSLFAIVGLLVLRVSADQAKTGSSQSSDPLVQIRETGVIRIAVPPPEPPASVGGPNEGFDLRVAREIGRRLDVRVEVVVDDRDRLAAGGWDIAVGYPIEAAGPTAVYRYTRPIAFWPAYVVVLAGSPATSMGNLDDQPICIPYGSPAGSWLAGSLDVESPSTPRQAPRIGPIFERPFASCVDLLFHPAVDAIVSDRRTAHQLTATDGIRLLGGPVFTEPIGVAVPAGGTAVGLVAGLDRTLDEMRADGTLADDSRLTLDGVDVTVPPPP